MGSAPRARGTHRTNPRMMSRKGQNGSAPRARGTRSHGSHQRVCSTAPGSAPRARGTLDTMTPSRPRSSSGSAPRARGTHFQPLDGGVLDRVSPACAGNTLSATRWRRPRSGQPRVRGEHAADQGVNEYRTRRVSPACAGNTIASTSQPSCRSTGSGSAPRARGTLWCH